MPTATQTSDIVRHVQVQLLAAERDGVHLKVAGERLDDDWLYIAVVPDRAGVRASDHAGLMARIERGLRADGFEQVLLVPAIDD